MAEEENKTTTIELRVSTRDRLLKMGSKGDTYDDLVNQLLDVFEKKKGTK